jgi:hypothetical protein
MKRPSQTVLDRKYSALAAMKQRLENAKLLAEGVNSEFWKTVKERVMAKVKDIEWTIKDPTQHDLLTPDKRTILTTRWGDCLLFVSLVEDFAASVPHLEEAYENQKREIQEYKKSVTTNGTQP